MDTLLALEVFDGCLKMDMAMAMAMEDGQEEIVELINIKS